MELTLFVTSFIDLYQNLMFHVKCPHSGNNTVFIKLFITSKPKSDISDKHNQISQLNIVRGFE